MSQCSSILIYHLLVMAATGWCDPAFFNFTISNPFKRTFSTTTSTVTATSTSVTVVPSSVTRYCATTSAVTGLCRRRRGIIVEPYILHEDADASQLAPSQVQTIEETLIASLAPVEITSSIQSSTTDYIDDEEDYQVEGRAWGYTSWSKYYLTTVTTTSSTTVASTSILSVTIATRTYTIIFCTPSTYASLQC